MASFRFMHCLVFFLLSLASLISSSPISYGALESNKVTGRNLLQQKQSCPVNFEKENYTIITSQCKGPVYKHDPCCNSFLEIACPHWEQINDEKTNCASTLFSYINLYGKYPPGLFASMCKGEKEGLSCDKIEKSDGTQKQEPDKSQAAAKCVKSPWFMIMAGVVVCATRFWMTI